MIDLRSRIVAISWSLASLVTAQANWTDLSSLPGSPSPRLGMAAAANLYTGEILFVGGAFGTQLYAESWILDGNKWRLVSLGLPTARWRPSVAFNPLTAKFIVFGGGNRSSLFADTWILDGSAWSQIPATAQGPVGRTGAGLAFDPVRGRILMQGGEGTAGGSGRMSDTWSWDGSSWTQLSPSTVPTAAAGTMATDWAHRRIIFVTNGNHSSFFHMTWAWDGANWSKVVTPTAIPTQIHGGIVYDSLRDRVVLVAGCGWKNYELTASDWVKIPSIPSPQGIEYPVVAYDELRHRVISFSGAICNNPRVYVNTHWAYATPKPASTASFGLPCPTPSGQRPILRPAPASRPWIGDSFVLEVTPNPQQNAAFMAFGLSKQNLGPFSLPMSLTSLGAPGCTVLVAPTVVAAIPMGPELRWTLPIPNQISLAGIRFYTQGLLLDSTYNSLGLVTTDAAESVVGIR